MEGKSTGVIISVLTLYSIVTNIGLVTTNQKLNDLKEQVVGVSNQVSEVHRITDSVSFDVQRVKSLGDSRAEMLFDINEELINVSDSLGFYKDCNQFFCGDKVFFLYKERILEGTVTMYDKHQETEYSMGAYYIETKPIFETPEWKEPEYVISVHNVFKTKEDLLFYLENIEGQY